MLKYYKMKWEDDLESKRSQDLVGAHTPPQVDLAVLITPSGDIAGQQFHLWLKMILTLHKSA